jgi:hypothetical protein
MVDEYGVDQIQLILLIIFPSEPYLNLLNKNIEREKKNTMLTVMFINFNNSTR